MVGWGCLIRLVRLRVAKVALSSPAANLWKGVAGRLDGCLLVEILFVALCALAGRTGGDVQQALQSRIRMSREPSSPRWPAYGLLHPTIPSR